MNVVNQNLEWELCKSFFSIVEKKLTLEVSFDELCLVAKISNEEVQKIIPSNPLDYQKFFLKILISHLDREVLTELEADIADDTISTIYDKILEGLSLRFEKYSSSGKFKGPLNLYFCHL